MFKVPEKNRIKGSLSDGNNGYFKISLSIRTTAYIVASDGEEWKPVNGYKGLYEISNFGRIRSLAKQVKISNGAIKKQNMFHLSPELISTGYPRISLSNNGKTIKKLVHVLVAEHFIKNTNNYNIVNHINGNKKNCIVSNLEWCSDEYNQHHAIENGLKTGLRKSEILKIKALLNNGMSVLQIAKMYDRSRQTISDIKSGRHRNLNPKKPCNYKGLPFWEHVSVHIESDKKQRTPTWAEMCKIKDIFWDKTDCVVQYHPPESEYVNDHKHTLHLWRPINQEMPMPKKIMV